MSLRGRGEYAWWVLDLGSLTKWGDVVGRLSVAAQPSFVPVILSWSVAKAKHVLSRVEGNLRLGTGEILRSAQNDLIRCE